MCRHTILNIHSMNRLTIYLHILYYNTMCVYIDRYRYMSTCVHSLNTYLLINYWILDGAGATPTGVKDTAWPQFPGQYSIAGKKILNK